MASANKAAPDGRSNINGATSNVCWYLGTTDDGRTIVAHDGVSEDGCCADSGRHLDSVTDSAAPAHDWDGGCYFCGQMAQ